MYKTKDKNLHIKNGQELPFNFCNLILKASLYHTNGWII